MDEPIFELIDNPRCEHCGLMIGKHFVTTVDGGITWCLACAYAGSLIDEAAYEHFAGFEKACESEDIIEFFA